MPELRTYQTDAIQSLRRSIASGRTRPLLVMPTGSGKTVVASELIRSAETKGRTVLFLAPRRELIYQASQKLTDVGVDHGVIMAGEDFYGIHGVHVACIPTLHARAVRSNRIDLPYADLLIVDEAHIGVGGMAQELILSYAEGGSVVVGLTATPARADGRGLGLIYDDLVQGPTVRQLTELGHLVPARYFVGESPDLTGIKTTAGDFNQGQLGERVDTPKLVGDIVSNWARLCPDRQTFVFAVNVAHSMHLAEEFRAIGVRAEHIDGNTELEERQGIMSRLRTGDIQVLVNCFDMETELLTRRGFVGHDDIQEGDEFAAVSLSGAVTWEKAKTVFKREVGTLERMVEIDSQRASVRVTEGHRMVWARSHLKKWQITEARELPVRPSHLWLPTCGVEEVTGLGLSYAQMEFLGLFYSDGHLGRNGTIEISQSERYAETNCANIERILNECGFDWRVTYSNGSHNRIRRYCIPKGAIKSGQLVRRGWVDLAPFIYVDKRWPAALNAMSAMELRGFIHGLWIGDGSKTEGRPNRRYPSWVIWGTRKKLLSAVQALCVVRGFSARLLGPHNNGTRDDGTPCRPLYCLAITQRQSITLHTKNPTRTGPRFEFSAPTRGEEVWCIQNETGTVIARRKGFVFVSGQCQVMTYGVDFPPVSAIVLACPTKSISKYLQMVGRGLRTYPEKQDCLVLDHAQACQRLGFADDEFPWALTDDEKVQDRKAKDKKEAKEITCPECGATFRAARKCPNCGHDMHVQFKRAVEIQDADLHEVGKARVHATMDDKAQFFGELKCIATAKGYSEGWAAHKYREKFGVWPNAVKHAPALTPTPATIAWVRSRQIAWAKARGK